MKNLLATFFLVLGVALAQDVPATVVDVVNANEDLSTLAEALEAAGLAETLSGEGPFTVFAPTNEAFAALPEGELERLLADPTALARVLRYYVAEGVLRSEQVAEFADDSSSAQPLETLQGETLSLQPRENTDEPIYINDEATSPRPTLGPGTGSFTLSTRCCCRRLRRAA